MADLDRVRADLTGDHGGIEPACEAIALSGRRHCDQPEIGAEQGLRIAEQREREIGLERAFMHLVENDRGDPFEPGIGEQPAEQKALGDDFDPGRGGNRGVDPGAIADDATDGLPAQRRHAPRRSTRGDPPRLQH